MTACPSQAITKASLRWLLVAAIGWSFAGAAGAQANAKSVESFADCPECPLMVKVPAGEFLMGSPAQEKGREADEGPQHRVRLAAPLAVAINKVTRGQYAAFVAATRRPDGDGCWVWDVGRGLWVKDAARNWRNPGFDQTDQHPVVCVSWDDAQAYAVWVSQKAGKRLRLLTEAEREYVMRAGSASSRPWGEDIEAACGYANVADQTAAAKVQRIPTWIECSDGYAYTSPVAAFKPNAFGLFDTMGNAWEWVEDCYHDNYQGAPSDGSAWTTGACNERVFRGGSWDNYPRSTRSAFRYRGVPATRSSSVGFRIGRALP
ncbi:MAG TPA: formylglycine-generating enzyme family protein [Burkholderiaceae bacterium]|nr:formylglycine-generating enzyme family protein [Burkholderiaceae bacterium]